MPLVALQQNRERLANIKYIEANAMKVNEFLCIYIAICY